MRRVDLPTPGSPPTSTRLPGTIPPPSTRFSSPQARRSRGAESAETAVTGTGLAEEPPVVPPRLVRDSALRRPASFLTSNSWSVFHSWQYGHWPAQRRVSPPHWAHTKVTEERGMIPAWCPRVLFTSQGL